MIWLLISLLLAPPLMMSSREFQEAVRSEARSSAEDKQFRHIAETLKFMNKMSMQSYDNLPQIEVAIDGLVMMRETIQMFAAEGLTERQLAIIDILEGRIKIQEDRLWTRFYEILHGRSEARKTLDRAA